MCVCIYTCITIIIIEEIIDSRENKGVMGGVGGGEGGMDENDINMYFYKILKN